MATSSETHCSSCLRKLRLKVTRTPYNQPDHRDWLGHRLSCSRYGREPDLTLAEAVRAQREASRGH